LKASLINMN